MFPDLLICNKQLHSKYKFKNEFPDHPEQLIVSLHHLTGLTHQMEPIKPEWNEINITDLTVRTKPDIQIVVCSIGRMKCVSKWKSTLTPLGYCLEMKLVDDPDFHAITPHPKNLALMVAANLSDSTYGWDGTRTGLTMYFYQRDDGLRENHKIELMSSMVSENVIMLRRSKLLGRPYTPCSKDLSHLKCKQRHTAKSFINKCDCISQYFRISSNHR